MLQPTVCSELLPFLILIILLLVILIFILLIVTIIKVITFSCSSWITPKSGVAACVPKMPSPRYCPGFLIHMTQLLLYWFFFIQSPEVGFLINISKQWFVLCSVHSPGPIRVVGPLSNSEEFASAYNCKPGSRMNPTDKCSVWWTTKNRLFGQIQGRKAVQDSPGTVLDPQVRCGCDQCGKGWWSRWKGGTTNQPTNQPTTGQTSLAKTYFGLGPVSVHRRGLWCSLFCKRCWHFCGWKKISNYDWSGGNILSRKFFFWLNSWLLTNKREYEI